MNGPWWAKDGIDSIGPLHVADEAPAAPTRGKGWTGPWGRLREVLCACGCGERFETYHNRKQFVDKRHYMRTWYRSPTLKSSKRRRRTRLQANGRLRCRFCQATPMETAWSAVLTECAACAKARARCACPKCGAPVTLHVRRSWCVACDPKPRGVVEVILIDSGSDRERIVWRAERDGWVRVASRALKTPRGGTPLAIELPTAVWVRTRR